MDRPDLFRLTRNEVDRKAGLIRLAGGRTKTGMKAIIPISPELDAVLEELWTENKKISHMGNLVFTEECERDL
jgi:integrase